MTFGDIPIGGQFVFVEDVRRLCRRTGELTYEQLTDQWGPPLLPQPIPKDPISEGFDAPSVLGWRVKERP